MTGMMLLAAVLISESLALPAPSVVIAITVLVGVPLIYSEERTRRTKFALIYYEAEILQYIRTHTPSDNGMCEEGA